MEYWKAVPVESHRLPNSRVKLTATNELEREWKTENMMGKKRRNEENVNRKFLVAQAARGERQKKEGRKMKRKE